MTISAIHRVSLATHDLAEAQKFFESYIGLGRAVKVTDQTIAFRHRDELTTGAHHCRDVPITLGRPRSVRALRKEAHYHELYSQVWSRLEEGLSQ